MSSNKLNLDSIIEDGQYKGKRLSDLISDKKKIFNLISKGYVLSDDVLQKAGIKKSIRNVKTETVIVEHEKDDRVYEKDTMSVSKIIKDLETNERINQFYETNDDKVLQDLSE